MVSTANKVNERRQVKEDAGRMFCSCCCCARERCSFKDTLSVRDKCLDSVIMDRKGFLLEVLFQDGVTSLTYLKLESF